MKDLLAIADELTKQPIGLGVGAALTGEFHFPRALAGWP
jgi:hypothetical protein